MGLNRENINLRCRYIGISCVSEEPKEKGTRHEKKMALQEAMPFHLQAERGTRLVKSLH